MKLPVFQKYFFSLLLLIGVITGKDVLNSGSEGLLKSSKSILSLQINHQKHTPIIAVAACNFVEENENTEDTETHFSFPFDVQTSDFLTFAGSEISGSVSSPYYSFPISANQKIHVLNCTFLI
ncbi:hypothetical protein LV89_00928 [Arcicella aurantiaca]|uniref:Uncharacterized protein n=1 Tax=Arcicella aurantiaca TaxID=591202 RepID=A0A316EXZ7_9BACT|nr:hypothetical protein [Arcicella aurantiaca]PWK28150.1 hypothetical protein LV89_00928 [Arcicella aurantiaca]